MPAKVYTDEEKRCVHQNIAQQVAQLCRQTGHAVVTECDTKREKSAAPLAFSLGTLQQACGRMWDMSPQQVLDTAQSLYEKHKATTYPRTDCGYLPESMREEISGVLDAIGRSRPLPAVQRDIGPVKLSEALQVLAGPAWRLKVDEVNREICFELRDQFRSFATPQTLPISRASQAVNVNRPVVTQPV